jgi:hypothetical protein
VADWRSRQRLVTLGLLLALAGAGLLVAVAGERFDARRRNAPPERVLYLPRDKGLKFMCLGYNGIAADMVWIRSVMYVGRKLHSRERKYEWLEKLYQVTTDLDPHWVRPYKAGAILLAALPQDDERAMRLLRRGMERNPWSWEIPYQAAQLNLVRGNGREAQRYLKLITRTMPVESYPKFIGSTLSHLAREGGDYRAAVAYAAEELAKTDDRVFREVLAHAYREALARWGGWELTIWARGFRAVKGRPPADVRELAAAKVMRRDETIAPIPVAERLRRQMALLAGPEAAAGFAGRLPADPLGMEFRVRPDGTVHSQGLERLETLRLTRNLNAYLEGFRKARGRPARDLGELLSHVGDRAKAGLLPPGAREFFRWPPARLPEHPEGRTDGWGRMELRDGQLVTPPGPPADVMLSSPLVLPPGPAERARRPAGR